jgi:hypothetical protein
MHFLALGMAIHTYETMVSLLFEKSTFFEPNI